MVWNWIIFHNDSDDKSVIRFFVVAGTTNGALRWILFINVESEAILLYNSCCISLTLK